MTDILKVDFLRGQNFIFEILRKKKCKNHTKNHIKCVNHEEKTVKRGVNAYILSLRIKISRFYAKSGKFCAATQQWYLKTLNDDFLFDPGALFLKIKKKNPDFQQKKN